MPWDYNYHQQGWVPLWMKGQAYGQDRLRLFISQSKHNYGTEVMISYSLAFTKNPSSHHVLDSYLYDNIAWSLRGSFKRKISSEPPISEDFKD